MITPEERFSIGLKALERIKPSNRNRRLLPPASSSLDLAVSEAVIEAGLVKAPSTLLSNPAPRVPSLQMLLAQFGPLYPYSAVLGSCEDGLPFLLDLTNPSPGSLLITAEAAGGKTRLLGSILASIALLSTPEQVSYCIISPHPGEYSNLAHTPNCQAVLRPEDHHTGEWIEALALYAQQQLQATDHGPVLVLAIDDLACCLQSFDKPFGFRDETQPYNIEQSLANLFWLIQNGAYGRVWVIATLPSRQAGIPDNQILEAFGTRLIGNIFDPALAAYLADDFNSGAGSLAAGQQFCVFFGEEWIRFWICAAD